MKSKANSSFLSRSIVHFAYSTSNASIKLVMDFLVSSSYLPLERMDEPSVVHVVVSFVKLAIQSVIQLIIYNYSSQWGLEVIIS